MSMRTESKLPDDVVDALVYYRGWPSFDQSRSGGDYFYTEILDFLNKFYAKDGISFTEEQVVVSLDRLVSSNFVETSRTKTGKEDLKFLYKRKSLAVSTKTE